MSGIGEASALLSAATWTMSSYIFQSSMEKFTPTMLNLVKGALTIVVVYAIIVVLGLELVPSTTDLLPYASLCLSGMFGITIGDTLYFRALSELGPRKTLILETLAAPFTGIIAFVFYGTTIPLIGWMGVALTLVGLYVVVTDEQSSSGGHGNSSSEKQQGLPLTVAHSNQLLIPLQGMNGCEDSPGKFHSNNDENHHASSEFLMSLSRRRKSEMEDSYKSKMKRILSSGLTNGIIAMFCQALGLVLSHNALQTIKFNALVATFYRLFASIIVLVVIMRFALKESLAYPKISRRENIILAIGIILGNFLAIWLQQLSLEYSRPEIAQTLLATAPLFALAIGRIRGEKVAFKAVAGSILALVGVAVIVSA